MMKKVYKETWDMESVFPGGSDSKAFQEKFKDTKEQLAELKELIGTFDFKNEDISHISDHITVFLDQYSSIRSAISEMGSFVGGLISADVNDQKAVQLSTQLNPLYTTLSQITVTMQKSFAAISEEDWAEILYNDTLFPVAFRLTEWRYQGNQLLSEAEENIINRLSIDGFEAWDEMYGDLVGQLEIDFGDGKKLSAGQAENAMTAEKDPQKRAEMLKVWEQTWNHQATLFARVLNHLAGFRLTNYDLHGTHDYLKKPLELSRMKKETLTIMWDTISANKDKIVEYFDRKAKIMGLDGLGWLDVGATLPIDAGSEQHYTFTEAAEFIIKHFESFSPEMAKMARQAFEERWIEAEDRPNKRPGGYCSSLPESEQSRIFMTFLGTSDNVSTLAHELGHAFHSHVMNDLPSINQDYAMNVAETASTFAELIVSDATIQSSQSKEEKIKLLDEKIGRGATMMTNIHARFLFEDAYYTERQKGFVSADRLKELMLEAQKEAYQNSLTSYHPMFWAAKLHFYITGVPFYNFPYTFGYLFSQGIYAHFLNEKGNAEKDYIDLLRDTASMTTEDLAEKHLNVDLTQPDFWQNSIDLLIQDIDQFLELTKEYA